MAMYIVHTEALGSHGTISAKHTEKEKQQNSSKDKMIIKRIIGYKGQFRKDLSFLNLIPGPCVSHMLYQNFLEHLSP